MHGIFSVVQIHLVLVTAVREEQWLMFQVVSIVMNMDSLIDISLIK